MPAALFPIQHAMMNDVLVPKKAVLIAFCPCADDLRRFHPVAYLEACDMICKMYCTCL